MAQISIYQASDEATRYRTLARVAGHREWAHHRRVEERRDSGVRQGADCVDVVKPTRANKAVDPTADPLVLLTQRIVRLGSAVGHRGR